MRTFIVWFAALAPALGCAYSTPGESVFDIHPAYDGGDFSTDPGHPDPNSSVTDAGTTCHVQGAASVSGVTLAAKDAIEIFDPTQAKFTFRIGDYADACSLGDAVHAGSSVIELAYTGNTVKSAKYDLASTPALVATFTQYDATCGATTETAASGSVTFDRLDECGGKGSLDLMFGSQHVTATFTASVCSVSGGAATCK